MEQAVSITRASTQQMTSDFNRVAATTSAANRQTAASFKEVGAAGAAAGKEAAAGAQAGGAEVKQFTSAVRRLREEFIEEGFAARDAGEKARESMLEARHAAMLAGEEIGIKVPRALSSVIAKSEMLGPIMANAFALFAVVGFIELAVQAGEKLSEMISSAFIYTEQEKKAYEALVKVNEEISKAVEKTGDLRQQFELIGLHGAERTHEKLVEAQADLASTKTNVKTLQDQLSDLRKVSNDTFVAFVNPRTGQQVRELTAEAANARAQMDGIANSILVQNAQLQQQDQLVKNLLKEWSSDKADEAKTAASQVIEHWTKALEHMKSAADAFRGYDLAKEKQFWEDKLKHVAKGGEQYKEIEDKINGINKQIREKDFELWKAHIEQQIHESEKGSQQRIRLEQELADRTKQLYGEESKEYIAAQQRVWDATKELDDEQKKRTEKQAEERLKDDAADLERAFKHHAALLDMAHMREVAEAKMHGATAQQLLAIDLGFETQSNAMTQRYLQQRKNLFIAFNAIHPENPRALEEVRKLDGQMLEEQDKFDKKSLELTTKAVTAEGKSWKKLFDDIKHGFASTLKDMLISQGSFTDKLKNFGQQILGDFIDIEMQKLAQTKTVQGIMEALHLATATKKVAVDTATATTEKGIGMAAAMSQIATEAAVAFAAAYASTCAIPIVGPELAPGVAAMAYADTMEAEGYAVAEQGLQVGSSGVFAQLHPYETVLPASLSSGIQDLVENGDNGGGGTQVTIAPGAIAVSTIDSQSFGDAMDDASDQLVAILKKKLRNGSFTS
jgi:hypothetical protein